MSDETRVTKKLLNLKKKMEGLGGKEKAPDPTYATLVSGPEEGDDTPPREPVDIRWIEPRPEGKTTSELSAAHDRGDSPPSIPEAVKSQPACGDISTGAWLNRGAEEIEAGPLDFNERVIEIVDMLTAAEGTLREMEVGAQDSTASFAEARIRLCEAKIQLSLSEIQMADIQNCPTPVATPSLDVMHCILSAERSLDDLKRMVASLETPQPEMSSHRKELEIQISGVQRCLDRLKETVSRENGPKYENGLAAENACGRPLRSGDEIASSHPGTSLPRTGLPDTEQGRKKQTPRAVSSAADTITPRMRKRPATTRRIQIDFGDDGLGVYSPSKSLEKEKFNPEDMEREGDKSRSDCSRTTVYEAPQKTTPPLPTARSEHLEALPAVSKKGPRRSIPPLPQIKTSDMDLQTGTAVSHQATSEKDARKVEVQQSGVETYLILEDLKYRGTELRKSGRYEEALSCFDSVLKRDPENISAYYNRGIVLRELGRWDEALVCFNKVLTRMPSSSTVWFNKGLTLFQLDQYQEALESLDQVIALEPSHAIAWKSRARVLQRLGRISEAEDSYARAEGLGLNRSDKEAF